MTHSFQIQGPFTKLRQQAEGWLIPVQSLVKLLQFSGYQQDDAERRSVFPTRFRIQVEGEEKRCVPVISLSAKKS